MSAPAGRFRQFLLRHCSAVTMDRLVDPILTDTHIEATAAAARGRRWANRRIRAAGAIALIKALALDGWMRFWSFHEWPVEDRQAFTRTLVYSAASTAAAIPLLMMPPLLAVPCHPRSGACSVPRSAVIIVCIVGWLCSSACSTGSDARVASLRPRTAVMIVAVLCSVASFAALAWIVPASNQAFRVAASGNERIERARRK